MKTRTRNLSLIALSLLVVLGLGFFASGNATNLQGKFAAPTASSALLCAGDYEYWAEDGLDSNSMTFAELADLVYKDSRNASNCDYSIRINTEDTSDSNGYTSVIVDCEEGSSIVNYSGGDGTIVCKGDDDVVQVTITDSSAQIDIFYEDGAGFAANGEIKIPEPFGIQVSVDAR